MFKLHKQLQQDTISLGSFELCEVLLLPDSENPWIILVPKRDEIVEWIDLSEEDQLGLTREMATVSKAFKRLFNPDKINVGALGNMVPQLHLHVIVRYKGDRAWPGAIWGTPCGKDQDKINKTISLLKSELGFGDCDE